MKFYHLFFALVFTFLGNNTYSQVNVAKEVSSESKILRKAVEKKDESAEAESYFKIGESYFNASNFSKSEEYFLKSKNISETLNDKQNLEKVARKLAQSQENQNKLKDKEIEFLA